MFIITDYFRKVKYMFAEKLDEMRDDFKITQNYMLKETNWKLMKLSCELCF